MRALRPHIFIVICSIGLLACQDRGGDPVATTQTRGMSMAGARLLHGSPGGATLLLGIPGRRLAPESDGIARYRLRLLSRGAAPRPCLRSDPEVLDAALAPGGDRLAVVMPGGALAFARTGGAPLPLDTGGVPALPGVAVSAGAELIVFTCGVAPETDLCLHDRARGSTRRLTHHPGPDGQPAMSADGEAVLFTSGRSGLASLWRVSQAGGAPRRLTNHRLGQADILSARFVPTPAGHAGPVQVGGALIFDSGEGVVLVDHAGRHRVVAPSGALVLPNATGHGASLFRMTPGGPALTREVRP